jgi:hypothetical protein
VPVLRREPSPGMTDDRAGLRSGARRFTTDKGERLSDSQRWARCLGARLLGSFTLLLLVGLPAMAVVDGWLWIAGEWPSGWPGVAFGAAMGAAVGVVHGLVVVVLVAGLGELDS